MKAFVGEVDECGLRRFLPEAELPGEALVEYTRVRFPRPTTVVWAVLEEGDARIIRDRLRSQQHEDACALLLNRAVELLALRSALSGGILGEGAHSMPTALNRSATFTP